MALKVALVGSGNFGSAVATILGVNAARLDKYENDIQMWVYEEMIDGRKLTEIINEEHENVKYLAGFKLPPNIVANPDLVATTVDADVLIFILPHVFLGRTLGTIKGGFDAAGRSKPVTCCSMIKGLDFSPEGPILLSKMIRDTLGPELVTDTCVMMGANIATNVASKEFVETTLGYGKPESIDVLRPLLHTETFVVQTVQEVAGVELCGALKNVVAMAAGFTLATGAGASTYATILRIGFEEMKRFIKLFFPECNDEIFFLSCGMADLICTCRGGRNARVSQAFAERKLGADDWAALEAELLKGQKLPGLPTLKEVYQIVEARNLFDQFPLFTMIHKIALQGEPHGNIVKIRV